MGAGGRRGCGWPEYGGSVRELRDAALLAIMSDGLLRVSEAAALEAADLEAEGANTLTIRRSKTDQEGEGTVQYMGGPTVARAPGVTGRCRDHRRADVPAPRHTGHSLQVGGRSRSPSPGPRSSKSRPPADGNLPRFSTATPGASSLLAERWPSSATARRE